MKKFLFVKGENAHTPDVIRFIKKYSKEQVECHVLMISRLGRYLLKSNYSDKIHFLGRNNIITAMKELNNIYNFDKIIPIGYPEVEIVSRYRKEIPNAWVPDYDIMTVVLSKKKTLQLAKKIKIPIPASILLDNITGIKKQNWKFPVFVKGDKEGSSRGKANSIEELEKLSKKIINEGRKPLVQEFIPGNVTYGVGVFAINGEIKEHFIQKEILSTPPTGGSGVILTMYQDKKLLEYSSRLIRQLKYSGIALVEFKYEQRKKDYYLMEINPKFWASIAFALRFNSALIENLLDIELEKPILQNLHTLYVYPDRLLQVAFYDKSRFISGMRKIVENRSSVVFNFDKKDVIHMFSISLISVGLALIHRGRHVWRIK